MLAIAALLIPACGGDDSDRPGFTSASVGGSLSVGSSAGDTDQTDGDPDDSDDDDDDDGDSGTGTSATSPTDSNATEPIFDVGNGSGASDLPPTEDGCQKVDVIFAVDNSGSMSEEHAALRGPVFDSFPQALLDINNGIDDFQLAVVDACPKPAWFHNHGGGGACNFSTGNNYMSSDSPALAAEFACVTAFSANGYNNQPDSCIDDGAFGDDDEQPGLTAADSVSAANLAAANFEFLRDDAILFVVTITDEDEELADVPAVTQIHDRLVASKQGDVSSVVYLGIAGGSECNGPYGSALNAVNSQALAGLFAADGQGLFWDLCQGNLEMAFQTAISTIVDEACQQFEPPA